MSTIFKYHLLVDAHNMRVLQLSWKEVIRLGKQITVKKVLEKLKEEGFIKSSNHGNSTSHQRYTHKADPTRYADIAYHHSGQVIPKGTLSSIERTSGVRF